MAHSQIKRRGRMARDSRRWHRHAVRSFLSCGSLSSSSSSSSSAMLQQKRQTATPGTIATASRTTEGEDARLPWYGGTVTPPPSSRSTSFAVGLSLYRILSRSLAVLPTRRTHGSGEGSCAAAHPRCQRWVSHKAVVVSLCFLSLSFF